MSKPEVTAKDLLRMQEEVAIARRHHLMGNEIGVQDSLRSFLQIIRPLIPSRLLSADLNTRCDRVLAMGDK
jgi:hypothetical protein